MKIKTSELTGAALDWAVAKCEGETPLWHSGTTVSESIQGIKRFWVSVDTRYDKEGRDYNPRYSPSTDWLTAGPIIQREEITVQPVYAEGKLSVWNAAGHDLEYDESGEYIDGSDHSSYGPTPPIAAMRCFCRSKLGDEVEVPDELS